jgi:TolB-like protein
VSSQVQEHARGKIDIAFEDLGQQQLKNIAQPVRVYRVKLDTTGAPATLRPTVPNKPSIAVLSFQNMSGDREQEYFADGVVEEIITAMSRMRWLFVIARNSSFTYKGRAVDVKQVGRELGVRYVLEGSVRRAANRVRITGQLIDASTGAHLWADCFEGNLEDIFSLQDQITMSVVGAIAPKLEQAEIERAKRKPTESLDAYDYFLRGMAALHQGTKDANNEALRLFYKAIELDPEFASAYGMAAYCYVWRKSNGWMVDPERETEAAHEALAAGLEKMWTAAKDSGPEAARQVVRDGVGGLVGALDRALERGLEGMKPHEQYLLGLARDKAVTAAIGEMLGACQWEVRP